ncbi:hypothetical protein Bbelb_441670 [Branchiostoma belcheri]|nr:hypothetical protein Bbelb_441670 [Branchiostoma belcheri]
MSSQGMVRVMGTILLEPTCTVEAFGQNQRRYLRVSRAVGSSTTSTCSASKESNSYLRWDEDTPGRTLDDVLGRPLICAMEVKDFPIRAQACASNNTGEIVRISWVRGHQQEGSSKIRGKSEVFQTPLGWQQGYKVWFGVQKVRQYKVLTRPQTGRATYFTTSERQTDFDDNFNIDECGCSESIKHVRPPRQLTDLSTACTTMSSLPDPRLGSLRWMVEVDGSRQLHMQRTCRCDSGKGGLVGWYSRDRYFL